MYNEQFRLVFPWQGRGSCGVDASMESDAGANRPEEASSTGTSYDEGTLLEEQKDEERITRSERRTSSTLLNAELSSMITVLRKQMSGARFFSDTSPIVRVYFLTILIV